MTKRVSSPISAEESSVQSGTLRFKSRHHEHRTTRANNEGIAEVVFTRPSPGEIYIIERLTIISDSTTESTFRAYTGTLSLKNFFDGTILGNLDIAEYPKGVLVDAQDVRGVWEGVSDDSTCVMRMQFTRYTVES